MFLGSHHLLLTMKQTPPPLNLPASTVLTIHGMKTLLDGITDGCSTKGVSQSLISRWNHILALRLSSGILVVKPLGYWSEGQGFKYQHCQTTLSKALNPICSGALYHGWLQPHNMLRYVKKKEFHCSVMYMWPIKAHYHYYRCSQEQNTGQVRTVCFVSQCVVNPSLCFFLRHLQGALTCPLFLSMLKHLINPPHLFVYRLWRKS